MLNPASSILHPKYSFQAGGILLNSFFGRFEFQSPDRAGELVDFFTPSLKCKKMAKKAQLVVQKTIEARILDLRSEKVILDADLAEIYGVTTKALNQAVRRNKKRFPADFAFLLTPQEVRFIRSQIVTGSQRHRDPRYRPYALTEHGAIMAATVLNTSRAVQMSVFVVRAFVKMRQMLTAQRDLAKKLAELEKKLTDRLDVHETAIVEVLRRIMTLLTPPPDEPEPPKRQIGFHVKEKKKKYNRRVRKSRNFS